MNARRIFIGYAWAIAVLLTLLATQVLIASENAHVWHVLK